MTLSLILNDTTSYRYFTHPLLELYLKKVFPYPLAMMTILRVTAALTVALLASVTGCSPTKLPKAIYPSPQSNSLQPSVDKASRASIAAPRSDNAPLKVALLSNADPATNTEVQQYINKLTTAGFAKENQGVWIQSGRTLLANYQGTTPLPAASITKVATTLVALQNWGPKHQFVTLIAATGPIKDGVLHGDLLIQGGEDPFFIWEDAIALGNTLNQMGIERVQGNLAVLGKFYMNYNPDPFMAGNLLKLGLNAQIWPKEAQTQYLTLPKGTPQPQVVIDGSVQVVAAPGKLLPLVRHFSLPLTEILKQMNLYSNNVMAEMLANSVGGAKVVAQKAAKAAAVPTVEIQLKNGSGARENRISPRAACAMFLAIEKYLLPHNMTIADVFAISRQDLGILKDRPLPPLSVVKTGTVGNISAVAGAMPTQTQGSVWFAILNIGDNKKELENQQDTLLQSLLNQWGAVNHPPAELTFSSKENTQAARNQVLN